MSDGVISKNKHIDAALHLDGDPQKVQAFYDEWARNYKFDTNSSDYQGPQIAASLIHEFQQLSGQPANYACKILDAGCGSGFVGEQLHVRGYNNIDGFDLSEAMAKIAVDTGCYREVKDNIDMMKADQVYAANHYDVVTSIGVFTLGHVPPEALPVLLKLTRRDGLVVISTRTQYYDQSNFQTLVDRLVSDGKIQLLKLIRSAPYNNDGDGHYWVFKSL